MVHTETKGNLGSKILSNVIIEQIINYTQFLLPRGFMYLGGGKQLPKALLNLESDSIFEDKSCRAHSSVTILFDRNMSHKANIL